MRTVPLLLFLIAFSSPPAFAEVSVTGSASSGPISIQLTAKGKSARIEFNGKLFAEYLNEGHAKPIIYPIIGPGGINMVRNWPIAKAAENEAQDHPHHTALWYTHGNINGVDFWAQGAGKGTIVASSTLTVTAKSAGTFGQATLTGKHEWRGPDGVPVLTDEQSLTFHLLADDERAIDYKVTLIASHGDLTFGDTKEGSMGIRTHPVLNLKGTGAAGKAINSESIEGEKIWGKRAKWVDYWAPIDGSTIGVAIFDHPSNPRYPTHWHARDYGLIAANPFGIHDFEKKEKGAGDMKIKNGDKVTFTYRFLFHKGDAKEGKISEKFEAFAGQK